MGKEKEEEIDIEEWSTLVFDRNQLYLACKETLNTLDSITCTDKTINKILNEDIVKLKKAIKISKQLCQTV